MARVPNAYFWQRSNLGRVTKLFFREWNMAKEHIVAFVDPLNTYVVDGVEIGGGTIVEPNVWIVGSTKIGKNCRIGFGSVIVDSTLEDNVKVSGARIEKSCVEHDAEIGYTAQLKRTRFGAYSKMLHHGYLGDATVGQHANIGAGVITANYDGSKKHETVVEDYAFIGTNVCLVAPIVVPEGAMIAAGSTVTGKDEIPPWSLVIARPEFHVSRTKRIRWDEEGWRVEQKEVPQ